MKLLKQNKNYTYIIATVLIIVSVLAAVKILSGAITHHYDNELIVCLDAGHGGSDGGATSKDGKRLEKDDNLALTLKVRDNLEAMGVKVIMTREDDSAVSLRDRCRIANRKHSDLFVAIHRNSSDNGSGFESWISRIEKNGERKLSNKILDALTKASGLPNRGVKKGFRDSSANNYYVNANTNMPSLLLEVGFISNDADNKSFDELIDTYAQIIAKEIYDSL